ncbi:hypothetical protein JAAARDRAFT_196044 [Jaapia argillacea MUCL 33604]|uniref:Chromatin target of PRMT1 protein C-terminal domain-containing protein n=1 Tax=Jaapia argillacea MUCL 33604 TaxID=933084 RepID=A0A067PK45_9AGAM|nr:hypothetical protein JAAARDRAFT_196044 [Jaapia argillacea MUCL 33604]
MSTPVAATQPSLASRVAPAPAAATAKVVKKGRKGVKKGKATKKVAEKRQEKSAADLDAEMEDYTASNAPAVVV